MLRRLAAVAACLLSSQAHAVPTPRHAAVVVQLSTEDLAQGQATTPLPDLGDVIIRTLSSTSTEFSSEFFARGIAWHKSGSVMMRESLDAINDYLASLLKGGAIVAAPGVSSSKDVRVGIVMRPRLELLRPSDPSCPIECSMHSAPVCRGRSQNRATEST
jgi:hypothetical protein